MKRSARLMTLAILLAATHATAAPVINEIRIDNPSTDTDEYFELFGTPSESLNGLTYIVIGDGAGGCGTIESVLDLSAMSLASDGYLALRKSVALAAACSGYDADVTLNFENSDNVTHMLVRDFTGSNGDDLDTNNDGVLDVTPWSEIVDSVALLEDPSPGCGTPDEDDERVYSPTTVGPDGTFVPGHVYRCPDGGDFAIGVFNPVCDTDTPGRSNVCPPSITNVSYTPCAPTTSQSVTVATDVTDANGDLDLVRVYYKLEAATDFDSLDMSNTGGSTYEATLPGQADQSHVLYYIGALDLEGNVTTNPGTAPAATRSYRVGLQTIPSLQVPSVADSCSPSTEVGKAVNVVGIVTHVAYEFSDDFFYIQNGISPNSGIKIFAPDSSFVPDIGDSVLVSGDVDEFNCQTEINLFDNCGQVLGTGQVRARELTSVGQIELEQHESMLVTIQGPIQVTSGFDTLNVGGSDRLEFRVAQGPDSAWVGDDTFFPDGIGYTVVPQAGLVLDALTGVVGTRSRATPKDSSTVLRIEPRRDNDVDVNMTDVPGNDEIEVVRALSLSQNRPNPFNPVTTIAFQVPHAGRAALRIYDVQGRLVRHLLTKTYEGPTRDRVDWDGRDDRGRLVRSGLYFYSLEAGGFRASRKMLLLK